MFRVAVGHSEDVDSFEAITEVLHQCDETLDGHIPQAGILFSAMHFDHQVLLDEVNKKYPDLQLIGCTSAGEVSSVLEFAEDSITLLLFCSDEVEITAGLGMGVADDPAAAAEQAVQSAREKRETGGAEKLCITLLDPLPSGLSPGFNALKEVLGSAFPIIGGGAAADQKEQAEMYQFYKNQVFRGGIPILLFSGNLVFSIGVKGKQNLFGSKKRVTRSCGNVVYDIDGKPALEYYHYYMGDTFNLFTEYVLAVFDSGDSQYCIRVAFTCDEQTGAIICNGDIPEGAWVQITETDRPSLILSAADAVNQLTESYPGKQPVMALVFSCAIRKLLLGTRVVEEYGILRKGIGNLPVCGFYTTGEFAPMHICGETLLHSETIVVALLGVS